jgi:tetratricopeptide (TPR) repeat protein
MLTEDGLATAIVNKTGALCRMMFTALAYSHVAVLMFISSNSYLLCQTAPTVGASRAASSNSSMQDLVATGSRALQQGDNETAERAFRQALEQHPNSIELLNNLAISLARQEKNDEAISLYERALKLKPGDPVTRRNIGVAYFRAHRYKDAYPFLEYFSNTTPSFQALDLTGLDLFALDRYREASAYLERALQLQPNDLPTLDMLGKAYWRANDYPNVTRVFTRIMAVNPNSAEAHFMLGLAYDQMSQEDNALKEFQAALAADPTYPGVHTNLGLLDWRAHDLERAAVEFQQELSRYPTDPVANCTMGKILSQQSKPERALPYFEAAIKANPRYEEALLELGQAQLTLDQPAKAVETLKRAIEVDPNSVGAHFVLGTALGKVGRTADASREREISRQIQARHDARYRSHSSATK